MTTDDPIIQEIRATRAKFQAECDNDPHKMYLRLVKEQKKHANRLVYWEHPDEKQVVAAVKATKSRKKATRSSVKRKPAKLKLPAFRASAPQR